MAKGDRITLVLERVRLSVSATRVGGKVRLTPPDHNRVVKVEEVNAARSTENEVVLRQVEVDDQDILAVIHDTERESVMVVPL